MRLESPAIPEGGALPVRYSKDGRAFSPPVRWSGVPADAVELVLVMEGLTPATQPPHVHWCVHAIPPDLDGLPEGLMSQTDPEGVPVRQAEGDAGKTGYDAPVGTAGRRMDFRMRLLALDRALDLPPHSHAHAVVTRAERRARDEAWLSFHYRRPR